MKWTYFIKQKIKVAFLLFCIMACTILIRVLEDKNVKNITNSLLSLYDDRLIPASDIFYMAEHLHAKRYLILNFISSPSSSQLQALDSQLKPHGLAIDSLLKKYSETYLVAQEKQYLDSFKELLTEYRKLEKELLKTPLPEILQKTGQFKKESEIALNNAIAKLSELEKLQTQVGRELMADAQFVVSGTKLFSVLQIGLSIVIGVMVVVLVLESKSVVKKQQPFNMN
jgi:type IV secretory pathway VirB6-like protein